MKDKQYCVGAQEKIRLRLNLRFLRIEISDDVNRVEHPGIRGVSGKNPGCERTLQRSEAENACAVVAQHKSNEAVAQATDPVVKNERMRHH